MRKPDIYYKIRDFFNPRQRWLTKEIPRSYRDKDTLIETCIFACLRNYVEVELEVDWVKDKTRWVGQGDTPVGQIAFEDECYRQYLLLNDSLPCLEKLLEVQWAMHEPVKESGSFFPSYSKEFIEETDKLEKSIYDLKTSIMTWVVENRDKMWT